MKAGNKTKYVIGEWTKDCMVANAKKKDKEYIKSTQEYQNLPWGEECKSETFTKDEVKVIINGHRYNLS